VQVQPQQLAQTDNKKLLSESMAKQKKDKDLLAGTLAKQNEEAYGINNVV